MDKLPNGATLKLRWGRFGGMGAVQKNCQRVVDLLVAEKGARGPNRRITLNVKKQDGKVTNSKSAMIRYNTS